MKNRSDHAGTTLDATHDGYRAYNILHRRKLTLSADGRRLSGLDELTPLKSQMPVRHSSSLRFHLEPSTQIQRYEDAGRLLLTLADGQAWLFSVEKETAEIEESIHFAQASGARRSLQIAVHTTSGLINWSLQDVSPKAES